MKDKFGQTMKFHFVNLMRKIPEIAKPLKPTASTRKEMATPRVWENPTTNSKVASIPKPDRNMSVSLYR